MVKLLDPVFEVPSLVQVRTPWNFGLSLQSNWTSARSSCCMHGLKQARDRDAITYACGTCYKVAFELDVRTSIASNCRAGQEAPYLEPILAQLTNSVLEAVVLASAVEAEVAELRSTWPS